MIKTDVILIDPELITDLQDLTTKYAEAQQSADKIKWQIAQKVNDGYSEHKGIFAGDKIAYYVECSRVANDGLAIKIFGESGQTLRRWCEVQAAYENFPQAELLLEETSFKHLSIAKRAAKQEKAESPIAAMDWALAMGASADDMQEHYFPSIAPHPYDKLKDTLEWMTTKDAWQFIKNTERRDECIFYTNVIRKIVATELEKEGKAV